MALGFVLCDVDCVIVAVLLFELLAGDLFFERVQAALVGDYELALGQVLYDMVLVADAHFGLGKITEECLEMLSQRSRT